MQVRGASVCPLAASDGLRLRGRRRGPEGDGVSTPPPPPVHGLAGVSRGSSEGFTTTPAAGVSASLEK